MTCVHTGNDITRAQRPAPPGRCDRCAVYTNMKAEGAGVKWHVCMLLVACWHATLLCRVCVNRIESVYTCARVERMSG